MKLQDTTSEGAKATKAITIPTTEQQQQEQEKPLSASQEKALALALRFQNLLITGGAGCGKSYLIKRIVEELEKRKLNVQVTGTTGSAAWHIEGTTFHRFMGCGLATENVEQLKKKLDTNYPRLTEIKNTDVLIIDEISMMNAELFDKFQALARHVKKSSRPFGGIQIVAVGDFLQLPPVDKEKKSFTAATTHGGNMAATAAATRKRYIFQTDAWRLSDFKSVNLEENFRQSEDSRFLQLLNNARLGVLTPDDETLLKTRIRLKRANNADGCVTRIFSCKNDVNRVNNKKLSRIDGDKHVYRGHYINCATVGKQQQQQQQQGLRKVQNTGAMTHPDKQTPQPEQDSYFKSLPVDHEIELKVGALVLLCCNLDVENGLFNGTPGKVVAFKQCKSIDGSSEDSSDTDVTAATPAKNENSATTTTTTNDRPVNNIWEMDDMAKWLPVVEFSNGEKIGRAHV
jgi:ATP-dependent DNA helicase PIF1